MASLVQELPLAFDRVAEMLLSAVLLTVLATILLGLMRAGWGAGARRVRHRRSSLLPGETTFVGRAGRAGPELFVVGAGVRRLPLLQGRTPGWWRETGQLLAVVAATVLQEALGRRPSRDLAWAFVEERLAHVPADGFVLESSEVLAWLDARHGSPSNPGSRAREAISACAASVASRFRSTSRAGAEDRVSGSRKGR